MATDDRGYRGTHLLTAFVLGAAAGALIAYLITPESGRHHRERLKDAARSAGRAARDVPGRLHDSWSRAVEAARSVLEDALDEGTHR